MTKGYIVLDLAAFRGGATFVPGRKLPRGDKPSLERQCAATLLQHLSAASGLAVQNLRSNPTDPPDVLFESRGITIGIELVELVPENRLARDHQLNAIRDRLLDRLPIGELTRNWVINIKLANDYAPRISLPPDAHESLSTVVANFLRQPSLEDREHWLTVPDSLREIVHELSATRSNLHDDPRLRQPSAPLITFGAQATNIVPDIDLPKLLDACVLPKLQQDLAGPTWLLMWSSHHSLLPMTDELVPHMRHWLSRFPGKYARMFYLTDHAHSTITEFHWIPTSEPGAQQGMP